MRLRPLQASRANHLKGNAKTRCHVIESWRLRAWAIFGRPPQGTQFIGALATRNLCDFAAYLKYFVEI